MSNERRLVPVRLDQYRPLREVVYETLRDAISAEILPTGERLMEIQVAEELGVSRTPVREAIRRLEIEGLVVMIPRRGTYVANLSIRDINDVFEIREALESLAAGLAADRITDDELEDMERMLVEADEAVSAKDLDKVVEIDIRFHDMLYQASRNEKLTGILNNLREQTTRFRMISLSAPGRLKNTLEEHRELVEALGNRDVAEASRAAQAHLANAEHTVLIETARKGKA